MDAAQFAERMAQIRARFAAKLNGKIEDTDAALIVAVGDGKKRSRQSPPIYRRFHEVCGIGPTIGFKPNRTASHEPSSTRSWSCRFAANAD